MSKNIDQIFTANPITTNASTDLMYFGQSPYGAGNDAAMLYSNFAAQFVQSSVLTTKGDVLTYSTTNARLAIGLVNGQVLQVNSAAVTGNSWSTASYLSTTTINRILYSTANNVVGELATVNNASLSTNATGVPTWLALTDGQVVIGSSIGTPLAATLSAGTGISIAVGHNTITISSSGVGSLVWNDVAGTTQAAVVNNGYIISNASQTTVTLPATVAEGSVFAIQGKGAAGWILQMNTGQTCHLGSSASSSAGSLTSTNLWDSVSIVCVTANTTFAVTSVIGNLTVA